MREPDLDPLCRWLGVKRHAVLFEPGLTSSGPIGARLRALAPSRLGARDHAWASVGRALVRQDGLPSALGPVVGSDWRYRVLFALPRPVLRALVPRLVFPAAVVQELGPIMFTGKTRIKVFRTDGNILNVAHKGAEDLLLADVAARESDPAEAGLTPGLKQAGTRRGVPYFIEPFVDGRPLAQERRDPATLWHLVGRLYPWYQSHDIGPLGTPSEHVREVTRVAREIGQGSVPEARDAAAQHGLDEILTRCEAMGATVSPAPLSGARVHGDLNPGNILRAGDRWTLLDWECSRRASLTHDVFNFASWLAVFENDFSAIGKALRGEGPISILLSGSESATATHSPPEIARAYGLAYAVEKLLLQLQTGRRDGHVLLRRLGRWSPYWRWLLDALEGPPSSAADIGPTGLPL